MDIVRKQLKEIIVPNQVAGISSANEKIMWGNTELRPGKITILKRINLWQDSPHESGKLQMVRILDVHEEHRVYKYREDYGGQYGVGDGMYITKMPEHIKYETQSKAMLEKLKNNII